MSRLAAPASKLSRTLSSTSAARAANPRLDASIHNAGAVLMPKYAELLRSRRPHEHSDPSRRLTTTHRPTPQPSIANRPKPLMQAFSSSAAASASSSSSSSSSHLDAAVLPAMSSLDAVARAVRLPLMPLLPDNYGAAHQVSDSDIPVSIPSASIVAANPDNVLPATPLSSLEGIGLDGVELKFVHEQQPAASSSGAAVQEEEGQGMIRDLWKGMVQDILGSSHASTHKTV